MITMPGTPSNHATMYLMTYSSFRRSLADTMCASVFGKHTCRACVSVGIPLHARQPCGRDLRARDPTEVPGRRLIVGDVEAKCPLASHSTANHSTGANTVPYRMVRTTPHEDRATTGAAAIFRVAAAGRNLGGEVGVRRPSERRPRVRRGYLRDLSRHRNRYGLRLLTVNAKAKGTRNEHGSMRLGALRRTNATECGPPLPASPPGEATMERHESWRLLAARWRRARQESSVGRAACDARCTARRR